LAANASVADREDLTPLIARFRVRPDGPIPPFEPGQYFSLGLPVDAGMVLRPYSTASPRGIEDMLEFLVRRVPSGTFTPTLWRTAVGDRIWIGPPKGLFKLMPNDPRVHLFVSSGTGIAPFISMLSEVLVSGAAGRTAGPAAALGPRVVVAHGVSYASELAYRDRLEHLATGDPRLAYIPTVSRPDAPENAGWAGRTGRVESILAGICEDLQLDPSGTVAYLCGNPDMVASSREVLVGLGLPADAILHENYWVASGS
jgi:ferredoxin/flavodoxin---NADP+ reductase